MLVNKGGLQDPIKEADAKKAGVTIPKSFKLEVKKFENVDLAPAAAASDKSEKTAPEKKQSTTAATSAVKKPVQNKALKEYPALDGDLSKDPIGTACRDRILTN